MAKFGYTILYVKDVAKAIRFYEEAFGFQRKFITPENDYGELDVGSTTLSFASHGMGETNLSFRYRKVDPQDQPFGFEIGMVTDDVPGVLAKAVGAGAVIVSEAKQKPWGQTVAYIRDPEGFLVEVCTPMEGG